jgi:hypothetical protein
MGRREGFYAFLVKVGKALSADRVAAFIRRHHATRSSAIGQSEKDAGRAVLRSLGEAG